MNFISLIYLASFIVFSILFFLLPKKIQPYLLLIASLGFYAYSGWQSLLCLIGLGLIGYLSGLFLGRNISHSKGNELSEKEIKKNRVFRKVIIGVSIILDFLILIYGKFGVSLIQEINSSAKASDILIPLGLSFIVFENISYTVDVYRQTIEYERNPFNYYLFICYFPKILMGPIERYGKFMPELLKEHQAQSEDIQQGSVRILLGFFKKIVVAESIYPFINNVLNEKSNVGSLVVLALLLYSFYLYLDFSGYMDIAVGSSQVLGIKLSENFRSPYLSTSIGEFWRRWHITLGAFFKDYVYYPLMMSPL
ncbi:MAG: MBOAT family O-acyltransferase [Bacilli bacterium]